MAPRNAAPWIYKLERNYSWESHIPLDRDWAFQDKKGRIRLLISAEGKITVIRGYSWDGCTPKLYLLDMVFGVPDGVIYLGTEKPKTYYASLVHDALYQFLPYGLPLSRAQADRCFLRLMKDSEFLPRHVYYVAVRLLGWLTTPFAHWIRETHDGRRIDITEIAREGTRPGE